MRKAKDPEFKIQAEFILSTNLRFPDLLMTISPAGFIMSAGMAMKMKRMGYKKGTYDVLILEPRGTFHGLFIEFKAPGNTESEDQVKFRIAAEKRGFKCVVCTKADVAENILFSYLQSYDC